MEKSNINEIELTFTAAHFKQIIIDLCDLPETFRINSINGQIKINIKQENSILERAILQETLRERFSYKERMEMNQNIINQFNQNIMAQFNIPTNLFE